MKGGWMDGWMEDFWFLLKKKKKKEKKRTGRINTEWGGSEVRHHQLAKTVRTLQRQKKTKSLLITN